MCLFLLNLFLRSLNNILTFGMKNKELLILIMIMNESHDNHDLLTFLPKNKLGSLISTSSLQID